MRSGTGAAMANKPQQPLAFLTGSHAYGTPHAKSDIDLVVPVDLSTAKKLWDLLTDEDADYGYMTVYTGELNLILATSPDIYRVWKEGTAELIKRKPVTRDEAIECFERLRAKYLKTVKGCRPR